MITMMFPTNIPSAWPLVAPILQPAIDRVGTHTIEDVYKEVMSGKKDLWVQWNGGCEAALVSEFQSFPKGLFLNIWLFASAPGREPDEEEFEKHMFNYAVASGCVGMKHEGRKGWERKHKHLPVHCENFVYYFFLKDLQEAA